MNAKYLTKIYKGELDMIEFIKSFLFGIVEGITEWLPISSTGHLILLNQFVKLNVSDDFYSMFEVVIQLGAILAVVILFWHQIFPFGAPERSDAAAAASDGGSLYCPHSSGIASVSNTP